MATNRFLERDNELAVQAESTYGTDPGSVAAGDFFKSQSAPEVITRVIARYDRDQDRDYAQPSVLSTQKGRESSAVSITGDIIPSGNASTPTEPDMDLLFKANMGVSRAATAHTTTDAGSSGVSLVLTAGGGASSGLQAGDMFAVDVDATFGYEVRQCVSIATDTVTMDRALSTDPAISRTVKVGTTYELIQTNVLSLYLKRFIGGEGVRNAVPGLIIPQMELSFDSAQETPVGKVTFTGQGRPEIAHTDTRPTPTTAGEPLVPSKSYVFFDAGASPQKLCIAGTASLSVNNGLELRQNESCSLIPSGVKRTGNSSRYMVEASLDMLYTTGDDDTDAIYDAIQAFTYQDILVQIGNTPGSIVAWRCPKFLPDPGLTGRDEEVGLTLGGGRCYGTTADDEVTVAFI